MTPARRDGRPQYYDIDAGSLVQCALCLRDGNEAQFKRGEAVINDPSNSPFDDGGVYTLSIARLPDNAVIHDPITNVTRTKDGSSTWTEPDAGENI